MTDIMSRFTCRWDAFVDPFRASPVTIERKLLAWRFLFQTATRHVPPRRTPGPVDLLCGRPTCFDSSPFSTELLSVDDLDRFFSYALLCRIETAATRSWRRSHGISPVGQSTVSGRHFKPYCAAEGFSCEGDIEKAVVRLLSSTGAKLNRSLNPSHPKAVWIKDVFVGFSTDWSIGWAMHYGYKRCSSSWLEPLGHSAPNEPPLIGIRRAITRLDELTVTT